MSNVNIDNTTKLSVISQTSEPSVSEPLASDVTLTYDFDQIQQNITAIVNDEMKQNDGSHDFNHIIRVVQLALRIAASEESRGKKVDREVVILTALLHDIADWKYTKAEINELNLVSKYLAEYPTFPQSKIEHICRNITAIGYKYEICLDKSKEDPYKDNIELCIVQDADRLDAIGAVGIARCFMFSGTKKRPLYNINKPANLNITQEEYKQQLNNHEPALNHFDEKLFKLRYMMKTAMGRELGIERDNYMKLFYWRFKQEAGLLKAGEKFTL
jgi:uncharacterized protein